jgi:uncharacterized protein CbrC (UPF0167 family)
MSEPISVNIDEVISDIMSKTSGLTNRTEEKFTHAAEADTAAFLQEVKGDLKNYSDQLANGEIEPVDFEYNIKGLVDLAELHHIKEQEFADVEVDKFKEMMTKLIVTAVSAAIGVKQRATL